MMPHNRRTNAPGSIVTHPISADLDDALASGRLDLALGVRANIPPGSMTMKLLSDGFSCAVRERVSDSHLSAARGST